MENPSPPTPGSPISGLLLEWRQGNPRALDELMPLVYDELRRLADRYLHRERSGHTLQATALVHEAYVRLVGKDHPRWKGRVHFFAVAAQVMRRILIDHARTRGYAKRGGGARQISLDEAPVLSRERASELVALDDSLTALGEVDASLKDVVVLRFYGGLSIEETAEALGVSISTVKREWRAARAWLYSELEKGSGPDPPP